MPELEGLPPLRRPHLRPREDDFADLGVRVGRRRRQRRVRAAGGLAATAGVVAFVLSLNGAPQTLRTVDPATTASPSADASTSATAGPSAAPSPSDPAAEPVPPSQAPAPSAKPSPSAAVSTGPIPTAEPSAGSQSPAPGQPAPLALVRRDDVAFTPGGCSAGAEAGWCMRPVASATAYAGEPQDYVFHACRLPGSPPGSMTFLSDEELYFGVFDNDRAVFLYGEDDDIQNDGDTITVGSGRCARWTMTWDTRAEDGTPLRAGQYGGASGVEARFEPQIPGSASSTAYGFNLDVFE